MADAVVAFHAAFVLFVIAGAALLVRWPALVWLHVPALAWGAWIEFSGTICPLTPLENRLREAAGGPGYDGGFIDYYLTSVIYPEGLTRGTQIVLGAILLALNLLFYWRFLRRRRSTNGRPA